MVAYRFLVPSLLGSLLLISACGNDVAAPNADSPRATRLTTLSPQGGATGVSPTVTMRIEFDGAMAAGIEQYVDLHQGDVSGAVHPMTCSWSADRSVLTCTPTTPLQSGTHYTLHLGAGMMSSAGSSVDMAPGLAMGGAWMQGSTMGGMHAGQPTSMMGSGWRGQNGSYGMLFSFQAG